MKLPLPLMAVIAAPLLFVAARTISPRASIAQTALKIPRFSNDGCTLFRINDKEIERYDLGRYLPESGAASESVP
ncbi:hypothetical protein EON83_07405 [bacterium]|nr:MAG: hypothetical protein EON83_07405 [bacterium]